MQFRIHKLSLCACARILFCQVKGTLRSGVKLLLTWSAEPLKGLPLRAAAEALLPAGETDEPQVRLLNLLPYYPAVHSLVARSS